MERTAHASGRSLPKLHSSVQWRHAEEEFFKTGRAADVQIALGRIIDAIAVDAYRATIEPVLPQGAVMLAAGGYGRRELFPYATVDILVLLEGESPWVSLREPLAECVRLLWDAGLRLNHTVRTVSECLEFRPQNIDLDINLLDLRYLSGDQALQARFENKWPAFLEKNGSKLAQHLAQHTYVRHAKFQNTVHHREPDVKDAPGGLRDWNLIGWLSRLAPEAAQAAYSGDALNQAGEFISAVRCFLHYQSQGDRNLLDAEAQERILALPNTGPAASHGAAATSNGGWAASNGTSAISEWMREYFRHAWVIFNEARRALGALEKPESTLVGNFRDWRSRLSNSEFTVSRERIFLRSPAQLESDPAVVLRLLEFIGRHGVAPAAETERRLEAGRSAFAAYCAQPRPLWATLESILSLPRAAMAFRTLQRVGLLAALSPEWASMVDRVDTEPEHRYTVDEHTLITLERATELASNTDPTLQRFAQLRSEIENPAVLALALLFHSAGKGAGGGDPVQLSAELAGQAMERIRVPIEEQREVAFLIVHQMDLAEVMSGRDVDDPATARQLAERVGTIERLKLLTVMTYGDLAAVSSDAMTPWRLERLWRAYDVTRQELTRELETERIQEVPDSLPGRPAFLKGFPVRYLRAHSPAEIEAHMRLYEESRPTGVAVQLDRVEGAYLLTVIARDMPALFASFAGAISSFGLDILKAEAFSNTRGTILDTFVFTDPQRTLELNPSESERLLDLIRRVALGKTDGQRLLRSRAQPDPKKRSAPPQVHFDSDACDTATLVEIIAEDRPGLLYNLATVFSSTACNIDVVLIDTKGHRAIDVFYVAHEGLKLSPDLQAALKEKLLAVC
jgi:[protein-PII] uridylyltransferase